MNEQKKAPAMAMTITVEDRKKGRPKRRWKEVVEDDMRRGLRREQAKKVQERSQQRKHVCAPYFRAKMVMMIHQVWRSASVV